MGTLAAGSVVLIPFPFSDLSTAKFRPAVVPAAAPFGDWIMAMVTSQDYVNDPSVITRSDTDFVSGGLRKASVVRPAKLFTAHQSLVRQELGQLKVVKFAEIRKAVGKLFR